MIRTIASAAAMVLGLWLAACSSSPSSTFYTLSPDPALTSDGSPSRVSVVVYPVTVPEMVDRPQIVTRVNGNQVAVNEFARWAGPLKSDVARVIAADLGKLLGSPSVSVFDSYTALEDVWRVRVDVMRFDSARGDAVTIDALWSVRGPGKHPPLTGHTIAHEPVQGGDYDAIVAAHDRALASVSRDIAAAIRTGLAQ